MSEVSIVFDTSALLAYARLTGIAPGEMVGEVEEAQLLVGIPAGAFLTAYHELAEHDERHRLVELATSVERATVLLPVDADNALPIADMLSKHDISQAHCVAETRRFRVPLATYTPGIYAKSLHPVLIMELVEP